MTTLLVIRSDPVPLCQDEQGTIRVGNTRVPLERILEAYRDGTAPETIVRWFDSLRLADVYAVIGYYLNHTEEVDEYLRQREALAAEVRRQIEATQPPRPGFREQLLARRARMGDGHAPAGQ